MTTPGTGDFDLTLKELRAVARYALESAEPVLPAFEDVYPDDPRPRVALDAARDFASGADRTRLQRVTALDAHRAAKEAATEPARLAALAAGDAAAAAYLHPIAKATQVGHILRAAAAAVRVAELGASNSSTAAVVAIDEARRRATPTVIDVLRRYPAAPRSTSRLGVLMQTLDAVLRQHP
ncbi:exonuclease SbcC [Georgenia sp. TF02-10]|uniref:putative immunity protein n=1 Tax=Georgenia sp. TF02-10 TaxID=2917725 RepID=UPI001FA77199|nr:exonuclease SbcC [Georgenia sp. TF02-10]UNX54592.1 exonuclease SbcC [Georgenia sp. TF02-10]